MVSGHGTLFYDNAYKYPKNNKKFYIYTNPKKASCWRSRVVHSKKKALPFKKKPFQD